MTRSQRSTTDVLRRALDCAGAAMLLALLLPVLAAGALAVLVGSGRPVFFGHQRLGRNGRPFACWKLRTMHEQAERDLQHHPALHRDYVANGYKLPNGRDPRVTPVGRWLRRMYVDEIPQLFNVLAGTMSLVGPRPIVPAELREYGHDAAELLSARPGIVGAWTALGRKRPEYPERARIELAYVRNRSPWRDVAILLRTVPVVLRGQGGD